MVLASASPRSISDKSLASALRSPAMAASKSSAGGRLLRLTGQARDHFFGGVHHFGYTIDAITHDPFDSGLQRLRRGWATYACPRELDRHDSGRLIDIVEHDVAAVGLECRTDHFDGCFDLFAHSNEHSISRARTIGDVRAMFAAGTNPVLLAHQGGWDEIGLVAGPLAVVAALLWMADRRARRMGRHPDDDA